MSYKNHAMNEFLRAGWINESGEFEDDMQKMMCEQVLELLELFSSHGHSGSTAPYAINLFKTLAMFKIIAPLTGDDSEWGEPYTDNGTQQNKYASDVFRCGDGRAYWSGGRVFVEEGGSAFTCQHSRVPIEFPWTQPEKPEYVNVARDEDGETVYPEDMAIYEW